VAKANGEAKLKEYSVLLLYPDYIADGIETYYAFVQADSPRAAVGLAQNEAVKANELDGDEAQDFLPLLVTEGHNYGLPLDD
jgi:hypothetical protein